MLPAAVAWRQVLQQPAAWYGTAEARDIAEKVLLYQSPEGGWAKNRDMTLPPEANRDSKEAPEPTIDNGATITQLRLLARVHHAQPDPRWQSALERGIDYLLAAQYDNGGWPQFYPLIKGYYTHITFNDDAMVNVLELLQEVAQRRAPFTTLDDARRERAGRAVEKGIACILRCQIVVNGVKTAWCAQHDEHTFAPAPARRYEHASLSGRESLGIARFLMSLENPSPEVVAAVHAAAAWFEAAKMTGVREDHPPNPAARHGHDRVLVKDPSAPPLWARFYEIGTNRPIYSGRDAIIRYDLAEVEFERRGGYMWHTPEPRRFLEKEYPAWAKKWPVAAPVPAKADAVVAADGSGDYTSLQEAISRAPMRTGLNDPRWVIHVKPGTYRERIHVQRERGNILVRGDDAATTVIVFNLHANLVGEDGKPIGTFRTPTVWIDGDGMIWENLTLANDAGPVGQALALRADGDRLVFRRCRFLGWQDTILVNRGRHYFEDCYIEGHVDFIFGAATAFFARSHIHCLRDGYITAASTPEGAPHGFVFADGKITGAEGVKTYLGRPWRNYARTVFLHTEVSAAVRPEGWHNWNKPEAERTTFYAEFGSTGPGANNDARVKWAKLLDAAQVAALTPQGVLGGADGWDPVSFK
jgi:pectinesterase